MLVAGIAADWAEELGMKREVEPEASTVVSTAPDMDDAIDEERPWAAVTGPICRQLNVLFFLFFFLREGRVVQRRRSAS